MRLQMSPRRMCKTHNLKLAMQKHSLVLQQRHLRQYLSNKRRRLKPQTTASERKRQRRTQKQRHNPLQSRQRQVRWSLRVLQQQPQRQKKHREKQ